MLCKREKRRAFSLGWRWGMAGNVLEERAVRQAVIRRGEKLEEPRAIRLYDGLVWLGYRAAVNSIAGEV